MNDTIQAIQYQSFDTVIPVTLLRPSDSVAAPDADTSNAILMCYDSVFAPYADMPVKYHKSLFANNSHYSSVPSQNTRTQEPSNDWIFGALVLILVLMGLYIKHQKFKIKDILQSIFNTRVLDRVAREFNIKPRTLMPMTGIYLASAAFIVLKAKDILYGSFDFGVNNALFYLSTLGFLVLFILAKNSIIRLLGNIFEDTPSTSLFITNNYLFYFVGALLVSPLLLLAYFNSELGSTALKTSEIIVLIIFTFRLIRGIQLILTNSKSSKLYLFYYLCILEIVPILVTTKIVIG